MKEGLHTEVYLACSSNLLVALLTSLNGQVELCYPQKDTRLGKGISTLPSSASASQYSGPKPHRHWLYKYHISLSPYLPISLY